jgi:hypothetical protein
MERRRRRRRGRRRVRRREGEGEREQHAMKFVRARQGQDVQRGHGKTKSPQRSYIKESGA